MSEHKSQLFHLVSTIRMRQKARYLPRDYCMKSRIDLMNRYLAQLLYNKQRNNV